MRLWSGSNDRPSARTGPWSLRRGRFMGPGTPATPLPRLDRLGRQVADDEVRVAGLARALAQSDPLDADSDWTRGLTLVDERPE